MAIILEAAYSKKLGLPNFSSHSYVVSIRTELADLANVEGESARLYHLLQQSVDAQIQEVGFLPDGNTYGMHGDHTIAVTNGNGDDHHPQHGDQWTCSDKQKQLILSLVEQHHLDKNYVEALSKELFGVPVKTLNRLQASGLIEELLERHGKTKTGANGNGRSRTNGTSGYQRRSQSTRS